MKGYIKNIESETIANESFRKVLYTGKHSQLVVMTLQPNEEIGMEVHETVDQFFRIEAGEGKVVIDGVETKVGDGFGIIVPAHAMHNVINTSSTETLKLYTIYSPAEHEDGIERKTKADALKMPEEFNGKTTE
ncbi:MAG: cupin domain-containing protein [Minisyncoccia bacterium]